MPARAILLAASLLTASLISGKSGAQEPEKATPKGTETKAEAKAQLPRRATAEEEKSIRESYDAMRKAIVDGKGREASAYASSNSVRMYEQRRKYALDAKREALEKLPQLEVIHVLALRTLLSKEELESLDGTGLFTRNVNDGNVQKDTMSNLEIDRVEIVKGDAYASLTREGVPAQGANFRFVPEDGLWKFDFERWQSYAEPAMAQARVRRKLDKVGLAMAFLRDPATGMPLTDKVLAGPLYATAKDRPPPLITDEERKAITGSEKTADPGKSRQAGKPGSSKKK